MKRILFLVKFLCTLPAILAAGFFMVSAAYADIITSGDIYPSSFPSTWTSTTTARIGYTGTGSLTITDGDGVTNGNGYLGFYSGTTGTVTVDGAGSTWTNTGDLDVGYSGTGQLFITNGGSVTSSDGDIGSSTGSNGSVTVSGEGSTWTNSNSLAIGDRSMGTLSITDGGSVTNSTGYIGGNSGSNGTVTVEGEGSTWGNNGHLYVGSRGMGILSVLNGGSVTNDSAFIGDQSGANGTAIVNGEGSSWNTSGTLYVGSAGTGSLSISGGGTVTAGAYTYIKGTMTVDEEGSSFTGDSLMINSDGPGKLNITNGGAVTTESGNIGGAFGNGMVTVDGNGSIWTNNGDFRVGSSGTSTLDITNGGSVVTESWVEIGSGSDAPGTVTVNGEGSSFTNSDRLYVGEDGTGTINITDSGSVTSSSIEIGSESRSNGTVAVDGTGSLLTNNDYIYVGTRGTGTLEITNGGDVTTEWMAIGKQSGSNGTVTIDGENSSFFNNGYLYVGSSGTGSLDIANGGIATAGGPVLIGANSGSNGTVTVDGADSAFINSKDLLIGRSGSGILNILNGSTVSVSGSTEVLEFGEIAFGDHGGSLTTGSLHFTSPSQLSGIGTIATSGMVSDLDITFDASHGSMQSFSMGDVTINLNQDATGDLGAGHLGEGTLTIKNGVSVASDTGYLGYYSGSNGIATIDGTGSEWSSNQFYIGYNGMGNLSITNGGSATTDWARIGYGSGSNGSVSVMGEGSSWTNNDRLDVGYFGTGSLSVTNGGLATTDSSAYIGYSSGSKGTVTVNGKGSTWKNKGSISVGLSGTGTLTVTDGGQASAFSSVSINNDSTLTVDAGTGSSINVFKEYDYLTSKIINNGTVRLVAGAGADAGTYTPMTYDTMTGTGIVQALGGIWDADAHTITFADAVMAEGAGGASATLDLALNQRALITASLPGWSAGAGFLGSDDSGEITFTARMPNGDALNSLMGLITGTDEEIFSVWSFSASGYSTGPDNPVYLSLDARSGSDILDLTIWQLTVDGWFEFDALDLAFDGAFASFTATELGSYAVTGTSAVPVPGTIGLLAAGLFGLAGLARKGQG